MQSTLVQSIVPPSYPALIVGQLSGNKLVILVTSLNDGMCVYSEVPGLSVGQTNTDWSTFGAGFKYESATVTLSQ